MDVQPARIGYLEVNGDVIIQDTQDFTIVAQNIWVKEGVIKAGDSAVPFTHKLVFQING